MSQEKNVEVVNTNKTMSTGKVRTWDTNIIGKTEAYKLLALAETLRLPILFVGEPGVAKTGTVISYGEGFYGGSHEEAMKHTFILETDEGTKPAEVKGFPDMQKLLVENKFEKYAPIAEADFVVINEVDKASGGLRNALLGVMNERVVFNGKEKTPCQWKVFVATCNQIPQEEVGSPFWDRFVLKLQMSRMTASEMMKYYKKGDKSHLESISVRIPSMDEVKAVTIPEKKLEQFLQKTREICTDRTLTYVPLLVKAASLVYGYSVDKALIKVAEIIAGRVIANELGKILHTPEMKIIMDKASLIKGITDPTQLEETIEDINNKISAFYSSGKLTNEDIEEVKRTLIEVTKDHAIAQEVSFDEI
jgi:hypothetical protein